MCAWATVSQFLPRNSATLQFQVLMSMQMDAYLKKGAVWYPFCPDGGTGRGIWGEGGGGQGGPAQKSYMPIQVLFLAPPELGDTYAHEHIFIT